MNRSGRVYTLDEVDMLRHKVHSRLFPGEILDAHWIANHTVGQLRAVERSLRTAIIANADPSER